MSTFTDALFGVSSGSGINTDFDLSEVNPSDYPEFHEQAAAAGWDNMSHVSREQFVDHFVGCQVVSVAENCQKTYRASDQEVIEALGAWSGYSPRLREKAEREAMERKRPGLFRRLVDAFIPF